MRNLARFSLLFSVLAAITGFVLHLRATTGVWAGVPYPASTLVYPNVWIDRWSVGMAVAAVIFFAYALIFSLMAAAVKGDEMSQYAKLRVLSDK